MGGRLGGVGPQPRRAGRGGLPCLVPGGRHPGRARPRPARRRRPGARGGRHRPHRPGGPRPRDRDRRAGAGRTRRGPGPAGRRPRGLPPVPGPGPTAGHRPRRHPVGRPGVAPRPGRRRPGDRRRPPPRRRHLPERRCPGPRPAGRRPGRGGAPAHRPSLRPRWASTGAAWRRSSGASGGTAPTTSWPPSTAGPRATPSSPSRCSGCSPATTRPPAPTSRSRPACGTSSASVCGPSPMPPTRSWTRHPSSAWTSTWPRSAWPSASTPPTCSTGSSRRSTTGSSSTASGPLALRFSHGLVSETAYADLSVVGKLRGHQRAADALAARHGSGDGPHLADIAAHRCRAVPVGSTEDAVADCVRAATWLVGHVAHQQADELLRPGPRAHRRPARRPGARRRGAEGPGPAVAAAHHDAGVRHARRPRRGPAHGGAVRGDRRPRRRRARRLAAGELPVRRRRLRRGPPALVPPAGRRRRQPARWPRPPTSPWASP